MPDGSERRDTHYEQTRGGRLKRVIVQYPHGDVVEYRREIIKDILTISWPGGRCVSIEPAAIPKLRTARYESQEKGGGGKSGTDKTGRYQRPVPESKARSAANGGAYRKRSNYAHVG
tara:strand:- start:6432 stop:6782 length:351 start_codon:yes stop_codon:yes gene_type:complete